MAPQRDQDQKNGDAVVISFPIERQATPPAERPKARHAIGDVLRQERANQDRTLADVAEAAAVSLPYLSEIERGRKEVSSDLLESVCDALHVDVPTVLERAAGRLRSVDRRGPDMRLLAA